MTEEEFIAFLEEDAFFRLKPASVTTRRFVHEIFEQLNPINGKSGNKIICAEQLVAFNKAYMQKCIHSLLPGNIGQLDEIGILPRPKHPETRFIGSWVCPCLACSTTMVSQWVNILTGPAGTDNARVAPTTITFELNVGMTADEQEGYGKASMFESMFSAKSDHDNNGSASIEKEMVNMFLMNKKERSFTNSPSDVNCATCKAAQNLQEQVGE